MEKIDSSQKSISLDFPGAKFFHHDSDYGREIN